MRVALFVTCFNDTLFPATGRAVVELLERLGCEVVVPGGPDLLRADARQHRLPARGGAAGAALRAGVRGRRGRGLAVGLVRGHGPRPVREAGRAGGRSRARAGRRRDRSACPRADRVAGRRPGGGGRRRGVPAPRRLPPDLPLAAAPARRRPPAAAAARRARDRPGRARGRAGVLRVRRHVRGQERRHVDRDALGQAAAGARHARRGLHRGRQLVPDAHRRRPRGASAPACAPCTSPRSWRRADGPSGISSLRARQRWPTASCGATSARRPARSAASGPRSSPSSPTGRRCATRARRSRRARWRRCPSSSSASRRR